MIEEKYYKEFIDFFDYIEETGKCFYNSKYKMSKFHGKQVGSIDGGYFRVLFKSKNGVRNRFLLHRLIFYKKTGKLPRLIDHIDRNKSNNKWNNLREATYSENSINKDISPKNKSGFKGVFYINEKKLWRASIKRQGKSKHLGLFKNKEDAIKRRLEAEFNYLEGREF